MEQVTVCAAPKMWIFIKLVILFLHGTLRAGYALRARREQGAALVIS